MEEKKITPEELQAAMASYDPYEDEDVKEPKWTLFTLRDAFYMDTEKHYTYYDDKTETLKLTQDVALWDYLMRSLNLVFLHGEIWAWNGRHYQPVDAYLHTTLLSAYVRYGHRQRKHAQILDDLKNIGTILQTQPRNQLQHYYDMWDSAPFVAFDNGALNMTTGKLMPHSYKRQLTWSVNAKWQDWAGELTPEQVQAKATVDTFLTQIMPDDETRQVLLQFIGASLARYDTTDQHYAFLHGIGRNGKGAFLHTLRVLFKDASAAVSLQDLANNRFAAFNLTRAAINIVEDMSGERLTDTATLKKIPGGDTLEVEQKFKERFSFRPKTKMWFSINGLPSTPDVTFGFYRRILLFPFETQLRDDQIDPTLEKRLQEPEALSYLAWLGVTAWREVPNGQIKPSAKMIAELKRYEADNDLVVQGISEVLVEFGQGANYRVPKDFLHKIFEFYAISNKRSVLSKSTLIARLKAQSPYPLQSREVRIGDGSAKEHVWEGIRLTTEALFNVIILKEATTNEGLKIYSKNMFDFYYEWKHRKYDYPVGDRSTPTQPEQEKIPAPDPDNLSF